MTDLPDYYQARVHKRIFEIADLGSDIWAILEEWAEDADKPKLIVIKLGKFDMILTDIPECAEGISEALG